MIAYGHYVDGRRIDGASGRTAEIFEPMTGETRGTVALASAAEVDAAVKVALAAQPGWAATNPQRRARVLMKFLELVQRDYDELAELLARLPANTARPSRTPGATSSAASRWWSTASARRR